MNEEEARAWVESTLAVPRETMERLDAFVDFLLEEASRQNLIASSTFSTIWSRHIVDSAQLVPLAADAPEGSWLDLGSGAGFPGLIVAALLERPVILIESRRKRVEFLTAAASVLDLRRTRIEHRRVEQVPTQKVAVISARAFAPLDRLFEAAARFSHSETLWLLPKGRNAQSELAMAQETWQGVFHVKQSVTDPESSIIMAHGIRGRA